jgi:hypothetical protein
LSTALQTPTLPEGLSPREDFMAAAAASLQAMHPHRLVKRSIQDLARLGDEALRQGVYCLVPEGTANWSEYTGREGQFGRLGFAILADCLVAEETDAADLPEGVDPGADLTLRVEQCEAVMEAELLQWVREFKAPPLDSIYPKNVDYSGGLESPNAWIVMRLEAEFV